MSVTTAEPRAMARTDPRAKREAMPGGIAFSAMLHVGLLALVLTGLPNLFRHPPVQETPIAVELVTIAPETRATHPNPYKPKPEAKPEPAMAPPAPEAKPEPPTPAAAEPPSAAPAPPKPAAPAPPEPEAKAPPPPPPPPPKPAAAQAPSPPPRPPEHKPKPAPQHARAAPRPDAKKADPAAFEKLLNALEQKEKPPEKRPDFDALLKNLTKQRIVPNEDAPPAPRRMAAAGAPSSQPKAPLGSQLTASELDALINLIKQQLVPCWNVPAGARDAKDLNVQIRASLNPDGTVRQAAIVDQGRMNDPLIRAAAESARRTFYNPQCTPLKLPSDKYEVWKDLVVNFDPRDLL